ncbi:Protein png1 [Clarireedia jacksonii]
MGRYHSCWEALGPARQTFIQIAEEIKEHLEKHSNPVTKPVTWTMYMIGRARETAEPTIMFCSKEEDCRKDIKKTVVESGILDRYPGVRVGDCSRPPDFDRLVQLSGENRAIPQWLYSSNTNFLPSDQGEEDRPCLGRIFREASDVVCGSRIFLSTEENTPPFRKATAGGILRSGDRFFYLTVAHAFIPTIGPSATSITEDSDSDFDFDIDESHYWNEEGGDCVEITSRGSVTPEAHEYASSDDIETTMDTPPSLAPHLDVASCRESCEEALTMEIDTVKSSKNADTAPLDDPSHNFEDIGHIFIQSPELDYALIEISKMNLRTFNRIPLSHSLAQGSLYPEKVVNSLALNANVFAVTGSAGLLKGTVSGTPSFIIQRGSTRQNELWTVRLDGKLAEGDCGSWVVEAESGNLFGHIVSGCPESGVAYIVPAYMILADAKIKCDLELELSTARYTAADDQSRGIQRIRASKPKVKLCCTPCNVSLQATDEESQYLQYFCERTVHQLPGHLGPAFWNHILEESQSITSIRHAIIAIGALNRSLGSGLRPQLKVKVIQNLDRNHHEFAIAQHLKAIQALKQKLQTMSIFTDFQLITALITYLLFVYFETFQGSYRTSAQQIHNGLKLFRSYYALKSGSKSRRFSADTNTDTEDRSLSRLSTPIHQDLSPLLDAMNLQKQPLQSRSPPSPPTPPTLQYNFTLEENIIQVFVRLNSQDSFFGITPDIPPLLWDIHSTHHIPIPQIFTNFAEAQYCWDFLMDRVLRYYRRTLFNRKHNSAKSDSPEEIAHQYAYYVTLLDDFERAYKPILEEPISFRGKVLNRAALVLATHLKATAIIFSTVTTVSEMVYDQFISAFQYIIRAGEKIVTRYRGSNFTLNLPFSLDIGIIPSLYVVATKCREPNIRRKAVDLLFRIPRREGIWDGFLSARIGEWIISCEEDGLEIPSQTTSTNISEESLEKNNQLWMIPEDRRFQLVNMEFHIPERYIMVKCHKSVPRDDGTREERESRIEW